MNSVRKALRWTGITILTLLVLIGFAAVLALIGFAAVYNDFIAWVRP